LEALIPTLLTVTIISST